MRDLSLHILDIVQNSIKANSTVVKIHIYEKAKDRKLVLEIEDNGFGMDSDFLARVDDPFTTSRTTRNIGLGIPLLKESALKCDGEFSIYSIKNIGTKVYAAFSIDNIDRIPIGDIGSTMTTLIAVSADIHFILLLDSVNGTFIFDTEEIKKILNGDKSQSNNSQNDNSGNETKESISINEFAVIQWSKEYIDEGVNNIFGGVLNEIDS